MTFNKGSELDQQIYKEGEATWGCKLGVLDVEDFKKFIDQIKEWTWKNNTIKFKDTKLCLAVTDGGWCNVMELHKEINRIVGEKLI